MKPHRLEVRFIKENHPFWDSGTISSQPKAAGYPEPQRRKYSTGSADSANNLLGSQDSSEASQTRSNAFSKPDSSSGTAAAENNETLASSSAPSHNQPSVVSNILSRAYYRTKMNKRFLVLINPNGGPGNAKQIYETTCAPILKYSRCETTVIVTTHRFHAQEIAENTPDILKYDGIICCSGDGTPHEVVNGLSKRKNDAVEALATVPLCQLPCGSGNSLAISINGNDSPTMASLGMAKGVPMPVDIMLITQGDNRCLSFLSQAFGTVADADLGTEHLRWMGGTRFVYGTLKYTLQCKKYPCDLYVKYAHETTDQIREHYVQQLQEHQDSINSMSTTTSIAGDPVSSSNSTAETSKKDISELMSPRFGTVLDPIPSDWVHIDDGDNISLVYSGKMPWVSSDCMMFPATLPTDGTMDVFITRTNRMDRLQALRMLAGMEHGKHVHHDYVQYSKVEAYRLIPKQTKGHLSFDGEQFPYVPFQVEILPRVACLLTNNGMWTLTGFGDSY